MEYGIHCCYWAHEFDEDLRPVVSKAKAFGFSCLELALQSLLAMDAPALERLMAHAQKEGVRMIGGAGLSMETNIASPSPAVRKAGVSYLKAVIDASAQLGIYHIPGVLYASRFYPPDEPPTKRAAWQYSVQAMREVADYAGQRGVTLYLEIVNRFATYLLNCVQEGVAYLEEVDRENVKLHLDTFHMNIEESSFREAILTAGQHLGYFHICEGNRQLPGQGHLPWGEVVAALKTVDYQGPVVFESIVCANGGIGRDLKIWRDLRPGADMRQLDAELAASLDLITALFEEKKS